MIPVRERYWIECFGCNPLIGSEPIIHHLMKKFCEVTGMKRLTPIRIVKVSDGISADMVWEASSVSFHGWTKEDFCTIDIYSCCHIDIAKCLEEIDRTFSPERLEFHKDIRGEEDGQKTAKRKKHEKVYKEAYRTDN